MAQLSHSRYVAQDYFRDPSGLEAVILSVRIARLANSTLKCNSFV
jgi:hypothetical protein